MFRGKRIDEKKDRETFLFEQRNFEMADYVSKNNETNERNCFVSRTEIVVIISSNEFDLFIRLLSRVYRSFVLFKSTESIKKFSET